MQLLYDHTPQSYPLPLAHFTLFLGLAVLYALDSVRGCECVIRVFSDRRPGVRFECRVGHDSRDALGVGRANVS